MFELRSLQVPLLAAVITAVAYVPSLSDAFVPFDDNDYVYENANVKDGLTAEGCRWAFNSCGYAANWHPLTWLSLMADISIAHGDTLGEGKSLHNPVARVMRVHNVLLHAINAALLAFLMGLMFRGRLDGAWVLVLSLLWSLHPLRTEVVCWISERKELLSVAFMLLAVIAHVRGRSFLTVIFSALAMLAKPVAVTLPALLLAWDIIFKRRIAIFRIATVSILSALTCWMTMRAQVESIHCGTEWGPAVRLGAIFGSPLVYIRQTFWPFGLSPAYPTSNTINWPLIVAGIIFIGGILTVCILWLVRRIQSRHSNGEGSSVTVLDLFAFGIAWSYVGLVPMLGIVKVGWQEHSDRYTYWVGCGVSVCLAILLAEFGHRWWKSLIDWAERVDKRSYDRGKARRYALYAGFALVAALGLVSTQRMKVWKDPRLFLSDTLTRSWNVDFLECMVGQLVKLGPQHEREAEFWLRQCTDANRCERTYMLLAKFIFCKEYESLKRESALLDAESLFAEAEGLLQSVKEANPANEEAVKILDEIAKVRKKLGGR